LNDKIENLSQGFGLPTDIVLLHGGGHGSWCWDILLPELRARSDRFGRILTLDMPGSGRKRGRSVGEETIASIAGELNNDIRNEGLVRPMIVGHSIAGVLLPEMAIQDEALFGHLCFLAAAVPAEGESIRDLMGAGVQVADRVGYPFDPATVSLAERLAVMAGPVLKGRVFDWALGEIQQDVTPPAIHAEPVTRPGFPGKIPSTYIITLHDAILPPLWQRRFAERLGCPLIVELEAPHEPFLSHCAALAEALAQALPTPTSP
jgi:pimeloyl-ACP methyl ester carboxylesterase